MRLPAQNRSQTPAFEVIRASHLGMCFGVKDAIELALSQPEPVTILGDLVHNETVLHQLRSQGVRIEGQVASVSTPTVMITAHGASQSAMRRIRGQGFQVVEATCPLVQFAHRAVLRLATRGYHPVIIGKRDHVEVRGLTEDLVDYDVVLTEDEVRELRHQPRFGVAAQTTQPIDRVRRLVRLLEETFPQSEVLFIDTVCQPTKQRQTAAIELARLCDAVVVAGGANSNNTRELVNTCRRFCARVYHVQTAADLRPEWFEDSRKVGVTAGTSTPDATIQEIEQWLRALSQLPEARLTEKEP